MLTLNGKKFARTDSEFTESLFDPSGTCVGYFRPRGHLIELQNMQRERIGVINAHGVLCRATRLEDGRFWYSYGDISEIGRYESYADSVNEPAAALREFCGEPTP